MAIQRLLLAKIESVYDTDPTPDAANAIETIDLQTSRYEGDTVERNVDRHILGGQERRNVNPYVRAGFGVDLASAGQGGLAPAFGVLLRACGFDETINVLTSDTADAGAAATITLAASASAVDDFYNGMTVVLTGGTGSGQSKKITDYVGSTKVATVESNWTTPPDATSDYEIRDKVSYQLPEAQDDLHNCDSVTMYDFRQQADKRQIITGTRGGCSLVMGGGELPRVTFENLMGTYVRPDNTSAPGGIDWSTWMQALTFTKDNVPVLTLDGESACTESFSINFGQDVQRRNLPGCQQTRIISYQTGGAMKIVAPLISTKNWFAVLESHAAVSKVPFALTLGNAVGQTVELATAEVQITSLAEEESQQGDLAYAFELSFLDRPILTFS